jgi:hypothetical protein
MGLVDLQGALRFDAGPRYRPEVSPAYETGV